MEHVAEVLAVLIQSPFVAIFLLAFSVFLLVFAAKTLGVTKIGPISITPPKSAVLTDIISEITRLEIEQQLAPDRMKQECRRFVKDAADQTKVLIRSMYDGIDVRSLDLILAGPVNNFIVGSIMTMVEKNHIADLDREGWNARKKDEFRAKMIELEQVLTDYWPADEGASTREVKRLLDTKMSMELFYVWDNMFERIRAAAVATAERNVTISVRVERVMIHYRKSGKLLPKETAVGPKG